MSGNSLMYLGSLAYMPKIVQLRLVRERPAKACNEVGYRVSYVGRCFPELLRVGLRNTLDVWFSRWSQQLR